MTNPNIKKDVNFVIKVLNNPNNKITHLKSLKNLIKNFQKKWNDLLGPGIADHYNKLLNKKYDDLQYSKRNVEQNHR